MGSRRSEGIKSTAVANCHVLFEVANQLTISFDPFKNASLKSILIPIDRERSLSFTSRSWLRARRFLSRFQHDSWNLHLIVEKHEILNPDKAE